MSRCRLGHGSYSTTWLARDEQLERYVAVKSCIEDSNLRETGIISALNGSYRVPKIARGGNDPFNVGQVQHSRSKWQS